MDIFSTAFLAKVVANLKRPRLFLLNSFFKEEQRSQTELILFEVQHGRRRIAPFVSPLRAGKVQDGEGSTVASLKPAYVKPKTQFDPDAPIRRAIGEKIGGELTPQERIQVNLATTLADQVNQIDRRLEWMAAQALVNGKYVISGENYPARQIDFQRAANLRVVLAAGKKWNDAGAKPLDDLQKWATDVLQQSGVYPRQVVLTGDVWLVFRENEQVKSRWNSPNVGITTLQPAAAGDGGVFMGVVDGFEIYTYADWYIDPEDDTEKPYLPDGTVVLTSSDGLEGYRAFGAIRSESAGYQALPYFPKSWVDQDPEVRWLLTQSAPLVVPYRVNASMAATVL